MKDTVKKGIDNIPNISIFLNGKVFEPVGVQSEVFRLNLKRDIHNPEAEKFKENSKR